MRLVIVEPSPHGHHMALHCRLIVEEAASRGWQLYLLTSTDAVAHSAFEQSVTSLAPDLRVFSVPWQYHLEDATTRLELVAYQIRNWRTLRRAFGSVTRRIRPDAVYMINLDYCWYGIAGLGSPFGSVPFSGMLMNLKYHLPEMHVGMRRKLRSCAQSLSLRLLLRTRSLGTLTTIDPELAEGLRRLTYGTKVRYVPDPPLPLRKLERRAARQRLGIGESDFAVVVFGRIGARKAVDSLLTATRELRVRGDVHIILAGEQDDAVRDFLSNGEAPGFFPQRGLTIADRFLTETEVATVFAAGDVVWLGYRAFLGMSGVLVQAAAGGLPVIASHQGMIGRLARRYRLGPLVDPDDICQIRDTIEMLRKNPSHAGHLRANGLAFAELHSGENFGITVCDAIEVSCLTQV